MTVRLARLARLALAAAVAVLAAPLGAQVGYEPAESPFRDLEYKQEVSLYTGWFNASRDPAGVAPRSGPMLGVRYEARVGGPAQFTARVARVFSERAGLNPLREPPQRLGAPQGWPLYLADIGVSMNLTGQKSFRGFIPVALFGGGIASDFRARNDFNGFKYAEERGSADSVTYPGSYRFGTAFALVFGAGVRWAPGDGQLQFRADVTDHLYQVKYPDEFYRPYLVNSVVLPPVFLPNQKTNIWRHNAAVTVGASYVFFR